MKTVLVTYRAVYGTNRIVSTLKFPKCKEITLINEWKSEYFSLKRYKTYIVTFIRSVRCWKRGNGQ